ncbi:hypothetical protein [Clostridium perfringens]|uniref:hypothetical protein n=1 Tax=Clostridium perfringens TaxID=1502 RepID=UPI0008A66939|nr:hypothetical protein [Clostridium perfringens]AOY55016.1 hypothetical protein FORC25_2604 [Clostridium perfringens]MDK0858374.1 hypothetical protein [Clostridium perfringens]
MNKSNLSVALTCSGNNFLDDMEDVYIKFREDFLNRESRPLYKGKFIFFNMNKEITIRRGKFNENVILTKPERFLHIASLSHNDKYTSDPCYNDKSIMLCGNECDLEKALEEFKLLGRTECYYRLLRIHRISEVLNLANNCDKNIQEWIEEEKTTKRCRNGRVRVNKIRKHFIRYNHKMDDYIVILKEDRKRGEISKFDFVTAFPIFSKARKKEFNDKYNNYCMKNKKE